MIVPRLMDFVGGEWVASDAARTHTVWNPATGTAIAETPLGGAGEVDLAVRAAHAAFPAWRAVPAVERARVLFKLKALLETTAATIARQAADQRAVSQS